jgi:hypothetical protein
MVDEEARVSDNSAQVAEAVRLWHAGDQQGAVNVLRPLADGGDVVAAVPLLQFLWNLPPGWQQGVPYAQQVARAGIPAPFLTNYVSNMLNDPTHREDVRRTPLQAARK